MQVVVATTALLVVGLGLASSSRGGAVVARRYVDALRGLSAADAAGTGIVLVGTAVLGASLSTLPVLDLGWWRLLGGEGNVIFATGVDGPATAVIQLVFLVLFVLAIPVLADQEERSFRIGAETRGLARNAAWAVGFGLAHLAAGVALGTALAMTIPGAWFTRAYRSGWRAAVARDITGDAAREAGLHAATGAHVFWNLLVVSAFSAATAIG